jgi:hypothetical protein
MNFHLNDLFLKLFAEASAGPLRKIDNQFLANTETCTTKAWKWTPTQTKFPHV